MTHNYIAIKKTTFIFGMKTLVLLFASMILFSCQSARKSNRFLEKPIPAVDLRKDVDFTYLKLQRFHPNLYWYISKQDLDHKFDSLKKSIVQPLTPNQFYFRLAPVVASINEGHLRLRPLPKRYSKAEQKLLKTKKPLFAMMDYKVIGDKLFVKENKQNVGDIKPGTEIIKINDDNVADLINKYNKLYSSDGANKTFQKYFINLSFFNFYTLENGYLDSARLQTKFNGNIDQVTIRRQKKSDGELKADKTPPKVSQEQRVQDYDASTGLYNRSLKFLDADSSIAYIRVKSFSASYSKKFYRQSFDRIAKAHAQYLVLDIRDNLGGSLSEINNLYSYLSDKEFTLIKSPEMTSKTSGMHQNYFRGQSILGGIFSSVGYPFFLAGNYLMSSRKDNKYYFRDFSAKPSKPKNNAFHGKIYVLVNGASFSASSIISAKLKYEKRAVIVGEETGGANDGTVAGVNNTVTLPNSRLTLPIGLFLIRPNIEFEDRKRGVMPDHELDPGFDIILESGDKTLDWVLEDIAFRKHVSEKMK